MAKIKIRHPAYSLVMCDLSAAEVRTAINSAINWTEDGSMGDVYREISYEKESEDNYLALYSYELLQTPDKPKSVYTLDVGDVILDEDKNSYEIISKTRLGDKFNLKIK